MGTVNFGIPEQEAKWLRDRMGLNTVVEGGTYRGDTALRLSKAFQTVYTIEKSHVMFEKAKNRLSASPNIRQFQGDTREHLPAIISENDNILFWLDAHWSGGDTYGKHDECPLLEELDIIFHSSMSNYAILIDDARLFLAPPPLPHEIKHWPTIKQVASAVPDHYDMVVHEDVIYIVAVAVGLPVFIQSRTTSNWSRDSESSRLSVQKCVKALFSVFAGIGKNGLFLGQDKKND